MTVIQFIASTCTFQSSIGLLGDLLIWPEQRASWLSDVWLFDLPDFIGYSLDEPRQGDHSRPATVTRKRFKTISGRADKKLENLNASLLFAENVFFHFLNLLRFSDYFKTVLHRFWPVQAALGDDARRPRCSSKVAFCSEKALLPPSIQRLSVILS